MKPPDNSTSEILEFLESIPLFSKLNDASALSMARAGRFRRVEKGEFVFFQSDRSEQVYLVRSGDISIMLNSLDGRDIVIDEMRAGDIFGYLGVLTSKNRSTSAIARSNSEFLVIPGQVFLSVVDNDQESARRMLDHIANCLLASQERESVLAFMDAQARLSRVLLEMEKQGMDKGYITISQDELAHCTGLIRQTVAKALGKWRRNGLLLTGRGRIMLLDHKALRQIENKLLD
jgi:CRP/FNR family transcriptional regulator, cyclic AMP receptor protein